MKKLLFFCFLISFSLTAFAQSILVAVTDFTARSGYSAEELENITELFAGFLRETKKTRVVTRSQWGAILGEHSFQKGGLVAEKEIRSLGKALGAQNIITGTMMKLGNNNILNISLLDVETGEMISTARRTFDTLDEFLTLLPNLATDVLKTLEKPSIFVGTWQPGYREGSASGSWEFNNDGSFIYSSYSRILQDGSDQYSYYTWTYIEGTVRGTYTHTNTSLTLKYTISGTRRTVRDNKELSNNPNYTESGSCTVSYTISSDGKTIYLDVGTNQLFEDWREVENGRIINRSIITILRKR